MKISDILIFRIAVLLGFINIVLGTLGAHAINFESEYHKELFNTALLYQSIHIPVLLFLSLFTMRKQGIAMTGGLLGFCWPLFLKGATGIGLGPIVPTGGMVLMFAWIWMLFTGNKQKNSE
ncbi:MAG: DUF423 domain-containing protein [Lentisphaeraceae bacterium]|nr:DUF423 domain-containing protein [Lentisphaeraceae bacterium]